MDPPCTPGCSTKLASSSLPGKGMLLAATLSRTQAPIPCIRPCPTPPSQPPTTIRGFVVSQSIVSQSIRTFPLSITSASTRVRVRARASPLQQRISSKETGLASSAAILDALFVQDSKTTLQIKIWFMPSICTGGQHVWRWIGAR